MFGRHFCKFASVQHDCGNCLKIFFEKLISKHHQRHFDAFVANFEHM